MVGVFEAYTIGDAYTMKETGEWKEYLIALTTQWLSCLPSILVCDGFAQHMLIDQ